MTDEELNLAEDAALNSISAGQRQIYEALNMVRDIHQERFRREIAKPRRRRQQS